MSGLPRTLEPNLLVGYDSSDDAAVYRLTDELALIQTVDFFPPVVDDPYDFGQIAAANALSDVYAMGGEPRLAMNLLAVPSCLPREAVGAILEGGAAKVAEAGAVTAGGHSIEDTEPKYGLCVSGLVHPGAVLTNRGAREGDLLVLTKPLGSGLPSSPNIWYASISWLSYSPNTILTTAAKAELLSGAEYRAMTDLMAALNRDAARAAVPLRPSACTDVTGFGLIGHAREMAEGAGCTIELWPGRVPIVPQALELARDGIIPAGAYRNLEFAGPEVETAGTFPRAVLDCLYDPQTSGGLLLAIAEERGAELLRRIVPQTQPDRAAGGLYLPPPCVILKKTGGRKHGNHDYRHRGGNRVGQDHPHPAAEGALWGGRVDPLPRQLLQAARRHALRSGAGSTTTTRTPSTRSC